MKLSQKLRSGNNTFGLVKKNLGELKENDFISFIYDAKTPGKKGTEMFDANPFLFLLGAKRDNRNGNILITGLNAHYLDFNRDKAKVIASLRLNNRVNRRFYLNLIHCYRLDRVESPLFKVIDVVADAYLLSSSADWKKVSPEPR